MNETTTTTRPEVRPPHPLRFEPGPGSLGVDQISKQYGQGPGAVRALDAVSLHVAPGEFVAIMGPSGSGKSTLMHIMAGLDTPDLGTVHLDGQQLNGLDDDALTRLRRRRVGFIFQAFNLLPTLDVRENILLPFLLEGRDPSAEESAWATTLIGRLGLSGRVRHRPGELSGGQQQRVAIARALVTRPAVVFADEPTGNLDSRSSREVLDLLAQLCTELGQSIVMVTHDPTAATRAGRVVVLSDGRVVRQLGASSAAQISAVLLALEASE